MRKVYGKISCAQGRKRQLIIPNTEIRNIFSEQILEQFFENERQDGKNIDILCSALESGNPGTDLQTSSLRRSTDQGVRGLE